MRKINQTTMNRIMAASKKAREKEIKVRLDLNHCDLSGLDLKGANLEGANFEGATLWHTNFEGANLEGANLSGANLDRAILKKANLQGASLKRAKLQGASLERADFRGANLDGSVLNLSSKTIGMIADDRLINQLSWILADLLRTLGREIPDGIEDMADQSHMAREHGVF